MGVVEASASAETGGEKASASSGGVVSLSADSAGSAGACSAEGSEGPRRAADGEEPVWGEEGAPEEDDTVDTVVAESALATRWVCRKGGVPVAMSLSGVHGVELGSETGSSRGASPPSGSAVSGRGVGEG